MTGRRVFIVLGAAFTALATIWSGLSVVSWASSTGETLRRTAAEITSVVVDTNVGSVVVTPARTGRPTSVVVRLDYSLFRPDVEITDDAGVLNVTANCRELPLPEDCSVDIVLTLPIDAALRVHTDVGDVDVTGGEGLVDLDSNAGQVTGRDLRSAEVRASTDVGDVSLTFLDPPRDVSAQSNVGDVTIVVPSGVSYDATVRSDVGDTSVGVPIDSSSTRTLSATTDVGDAEIRAR